VIDPASAVMPIAASDVAVAGRSCQRREEQQRHDDDPAADAEERAEEAGDEADEDEPHARILRRRGPLARLA
jgi:hypothetical protein